MTNIYNLLLKFENWEDFDKYMKSNRKTTLWYMLLEHTNYDWPHSFKKTTKRMIVDQFAHTFGQIMEEKNNKMHTMNK